MPLVSSVNVPADERAKKLCIIHMVLLSLYCSLLVAWVEELSPLTVELHRSILCFWHPRAFFLPTSDYVLFVLELILIPAAVIFACLYLLSLFPFGSILLRLIGGVVAVAGFPLAVICSSVGEAYLHVPTWELLVAGLCSMLWAYRRWPLSAPFNVSMVVFHYALWSFAGSDYGNWFAPMWRHGLFLVPAAGIIYTVAWSKYFRESGVTALP